MKVQDIQKDCNSERDEEAESVACVETVSKKKKRRSDEDGHAVVMQAEDSGKLTDSKEAEKEKSKEKRKSKKSSDSLRQGDEPDHKHKDKKKKKGKLDAESLVINVESVGTEDKQGTEAKESESVRDSLATETTMINGDNILLEDETVKVKGKKKKKDGSESKADCNKTSEKDATDKERKGSKKRKRFASEENIAEPIDEKVEESKRRKTEGSEELKRSDGQENGNLEKKEVKSPLNKTMMKQVNGSAEPKTVKAFQRVKIDEVVFTDERLKDNSYWAKDGAEIGYGAKAQEVLGQVRGRDFRHEKTKKKRGSYRGGMIDLHSHSVKFNYSDEE